MSKSERLLNLLILLLVQRSPLAKARIRSIIPAYAAASDQGFARMFDRDKEELRLLGVPLETVPLTAAFDDEVGYRISAAEFALSELDLDADEAAVVGLAARVWQHAGLAGATSHALTKLAAAGTPVDRDRLELVGPPVVVDDSNFDLLWQASLDRIAVVFDYTSAGARSARPRLVQPWGLVSSASRWYLVAHDPGHDEVRLFRLSRIVGRVRRRGSPGSFEVPADVDLRALSRRLQPGPSVHRATVLVRAGAGAALRRVALEVEESVAGPDAESAWDRLTLRVPSLRALADDVLALGDSGFAESPEALRQRVVARLLSVAR